MLYLFFQLIIVRAKPIKEIRDFNGGFKGVERITFECTSNNERHIQRTNEKLEAQQSKEKCWVDLHPTF